MEEEEKMEYMTRDEHDEFAKRLDEHNARQDERIDGLEKRYRQIQDLNTSVQRIAISIEVMTKELAKQGERLEAIEKEPAANWKKFMWLLFSALMGGVLVIVGQHVGIPL